MNICRAKSLLNALTDDGVYANGKLVPINIVINLDESQINLIMDLRLSSRLINYNKFIDPIYHN